MPSIANPKVSVITIAANNTAQKIFPSVVPKTCLIKLYVPSANAAAVVYGDSSAHAGNGVGISIAKGAQDSLVPISGLIGVDQLYVSGTANDKIVVFYLEQI